MKNSLLVGFFMLVAGFFFFGCGRSFEIGDGILFGEGRVFLYWGDSRNHNRRFGDLFFQLAPSKICLSI